LISEGLSGVEDEADVEDRLRSLGVDISEDSAAVGERLFEERLDVEVPELLLGVADARPSSLACLGG
jgi:hypothetical protein